MEAVPLLDEALFLRVVARRWLLWRLVVLGGRLADADYALSWLCREEAAAGVMATA